MSPRKARVGTWNLRRDRGPARVAAEVLRLFGEHHLDALAVQESGDYLRALGRLPGVRVVAFADRPGQSNTALLVRDGITLSGVGIKRMTWQGWFTVRGGETPAKWMPTVRLNGWLTVGSVHYPPSVSWANGVPRGPVRRVLAYRRHSLRLARWLARQDVAVVLGDWNATPGTWGRWTPRWVAARTHARIVAPAHGTHGRRVIDYALTRGVTTRVVDVGDRGGSDHHAVIYDIQETP